MLRYHNRIMIVFVEQVHFCKIRITIDGYICSAHSENSRNQRICTIRLEIALRILRIYMIARSQNWQYTYAISRLCEFPDCTEHMYAENLELFFVVVFFFVGGEGLVWNRIMMFCYKFFNKAMCFYLVCKEVFNSISPVNNKAWQHQDCTPQSQDNSACHQLVHIYTPWSWTCQLFTICPGTFFLDLCHRGPLTI